MHFYIAWYPGDPHYAGFDADCSMLVSVPSVAQNWTVARWKTLPRRLMIDSGGYRFAVAPHEALSPAALFQRQQALVRDAPHLETVFCARDYPLFAGSLNANHKDYCITQTIAYAYEFKALTGGALPSHWRTMAIVQGYDANSLIFCANELKQIGFDLYGIGSLAMLRRHEPIMERVRAVASVLAPERLHIFGVSVVSAAREMRALGIRSIDSSRPAKAAAYNEVLYSHPYRRYGILASTTPDRFPKSRRLAAPLPCTCPICRRGGNILGTGKREFIRDRATHNYYHLKRAVLTE